MTIALIDYGAGNLRSVHNALLAAGAENVAVTADPDVVARADRIVLPGVGAFDKGMTALASTGIGDAVLDAARRGSRILGICLGMQLLMDASEEGGMAGLGLVPGQVRRFPGGPGALKVPHMGWNYARPVKDSPLFESGAEEAPRFYFVHSYFASCAEPADVAATTRYGFDFTCAFSRANIHGVQFHPEKSHRYGMALFRRLLSN